MAVRKTKKGLALKRWFKEDWKDVRTGKPCGRKKGEKRGVPYCRPSKRVSSKTPKTSGELSSSEKRVEYLKRNGWVSQLVNLAVSKLFGEKGESDGSLCFKEIQKTAGLKRWRFRQPSQSYGYGLPDGWECRCEKSTSICAESWKYDAGFCSNA